MTEKQSVKNVETRAVENFLKAVYVLQQNLPHGEDRVSTNALKDALQKSAPSVTDMAQRLTESKLIDYEKYYGVRLTETGSAIALKIIRRHRLIELYLVSELSYALHEVHDEAEELEHTVSDRFIQAIAEKLGNPQFDPHGDPIPAPDGTIQSRNLQPLSELALATPARVSRLMAETPDKLQHTLDRGFTLNTIVEIVARDPFEGPLTIKLHDGQTIIGHTLAAVILVEVVG